MSRNYKTLSAAALAASLFAGSALAEGGLEKRIPSAEPVSVETPIVFVGKEYGPLLEANGIPVDTNTLLGHYVSTTISGDVVEEILNGKYSVTPEIADLVSDLYYKQLVHMDKPEGEGIDYSGPVGTPSGPGTSGCFGQDD